MSVTFYDNTPFEYGYSSKEGILNDMNPNLKEMIRQSERKIIADIGCGCGRNLLYSSEFAGRLIGVDISQKSLDFAKKFVQSDNLELIQGDNLSLPLLSDSCDLVISDGVIHHTGKTVEAFKECIRILKPKGLLYLSVYKKFRYYPFLYTYIGFILRMINKNKFGNFRTFLGMGLAEFDTQQSMHLETHVVVAFQAQ